VIRPTTDSAQSPPYRWHLVLFVHRVKGVEPGLYLWLRAPADADALRQAFRMDLKWEAAEDSVKKAPLYLLGQGDLRDFARTLSCHQDIAADGTFSLGMLARFEPTLRECGAAAYRELFWEAGCHGSVQKGPPWVEIGPFWRFQNPPPGVFDLILQDHCS